jgi:hypothetical protein
MTRIEAGVGDLVRRIGDDQAQVRYSVAKRSGGRMMPCAIRIVHVEETRSAGFPVWASKSLQRFLGLSIKTKRRRFVSLRLKTDEQMKTV